LAGKTGLAGGPAPGEADPGLLAREVWARAAEGGPALPPVPLPPARPGRPSVLAVDPPASSGLTAEALRSLAQDAARRACDLAHGAFSSGLELSFREDLARRAADLLGEGPSGTARLAEVAARVGLSGRELMRWALAWSSGGRESLYVLLESFDPAPGRLEEGKVLLSGGGRPITWHNRVTLSDRQLRLGRDGRWYPYRRSGRASWEPDGEAIEAPGEVVSAVEPD
ncbi:MAG: hypothetical protein ACRDZ5_11315, partial [Acidimicrobiales bacterium]